MPAFHQTDKIETRQKLLSKKQICDFFKLLGGSLIVSRILMARSNIKKFPRVQELIPLNGSNIFISTN